MAAVGGGTGATLEQMGASWGVHLQSPGLGASHCRVCDGWSRLLVLGDTEEAASLSYRSSLKCCWGLWQHLYTEEST